MTNQHCDNCGDPLFRDNGETFCPTCANGETAEQAQPPAEETERTETQPTSEAAQAHPGQRPAGTAPETTNADAGQGAPAAEQTAPQLPDEAAVTPLAGDQRGAPQPPETQPRTGKAAPPEGGDTAGDPRAELRRAVTETARKASAATDPNTARAWLEASKEAAEALSALER